MNIRAIASELSTLRDIIRWGTSRFNQAGLCFAQGMPSALDEAVYLCLATLHLSPDFSEAWFDSRLTHDEKRAVLENYRTRIHERLPAAYITNEAWFAGMSFFVDERVLIPRSPIAELIENGFQPWIDPASVHRVLDLCTGCGCIAIACAEAFDSAEILATDISAAAVDVARINVHNHGMEDRVTVRESDLFEDIDERPFDIIVSNPPYVSTAEVESLPKEFSYEPSTGLEAGEDGMAFVVRILQQAGRYLSEHGILIVEVGYSRPALEQRLPELPVTWLEFERGGEGVFLLTASQLREARTMLEAS